MNVEVDPPQPRSDEDLVTEYNAGQADALDVLIRRHYDRVLGQAYGRLQEVDAAREVAQDVFMRVARALPRFRGDSGFSTWLHRITVNVCLDYLRSSYRKPMVDLVDTVPDHGVRWHLNAATYSPYEYVAARELAGSIEDAITRLPTDQQRVFRMRYHDHMPLAKIARELGT